ncbi:MAG: sulfotransferase family protein [Planctomycetota bacterium]|nr:sulfotransferase family protein [Planctomycetota bacterium]MDA1201969.1 sulfotransferase family protein [Planctomycetota bacterium]
MQPPDQTPAPQPPAAAGQRVIAILGMHRSGTSLLAGTLQECGLDLGDVITSSPANEKGNRESWALMALHEDLLRKAGGSWNQPPGQPIVWGRLHRGIRDAYIASFADSPLWGFKDPRSLLVLEGWLEAVPGLETIGIFRHPQEVANSLQERSPWLFTIETALDLWLAYNRRLLAWQEESGCSLLEYLPDAAAFNRDAMAAARRLSLPLAGDPAGLTFHDPRLRHQLADGSPLAGEVAEVYEALRSRAAATRSQADR